ncbi:MAG: phosphatidylserine decarboxylase [Ferrovum sp.]|nr:phosphatidylserine decarboxylase [Ferrovum sp.]NDU88212.1 phosphatidylserine decarboxylase [Ferrovum sp.]
MKPNYPHPLIAREGWPYLAGITLLSLAIQGMVGFLWSLPFWVLTLFVLQFFRDPPRQVPEGEGLVLSPADGRIVAIVSGIDPYLQCPAVKVSVFMNVFNVHSNRSPMAGRVRRVEYHPGLFVNADLDKASENNERNALILETPQGSFTCVQVAGLIARRILCYVREGDEVTAGQRYGFIRFGSRVDVYLPPEARIRVSLGDVVKATTTVLAHWPEAGDGVK